ncbi:unnamed protein product [Adineta steineri]|uniref:TIR domain-containing protein n=1 Tax=Adineta steineri TaxID=433720 RepID=A0A814Q1V7_9BILA|nr:unnamed protein product [Adineta steineri]CAF1177359.1 unnamed protein product [Adineta steineri]
MSKSINLAFNEFKFGDSSQTVSSYLPISLSSEWLNLPQAFEYRYDLVRYFWWKLIESENEIIKFIPPNILTSSTDGHWFNLRCFHDQVPKIFIPPLIIPQIYKYDIMISYCHKDKDICHRIYHCLIEKYSQIRLIALLSSSNDHNDVNAWQKAQYFVNQKLLIDEDLPECVYLKIMKYKYYNRSDDNFY